VSGKRDVRVQPRESIAGNDTQGSASSREPASNAVERAEAWIAKAALSLSAYSSGSFKTRVIYNPGHWILIDLPRCTEFFSAHAGLIDRRSDPTEPMSLVIPRRIVNSDSVDAPRLSPLVSGSPVPLAFKEN